MILITVSVKGGEHSGEVIETIEVSEFDIRKREWPYIADQVRNACVRAAPKALDVGRISPDDLKFVL
jgi:hypothetical protein